MAHVRFTRSFLHRATPRVWTEYPSGHAGPVTRACADAAIAAGAAVPVKTPARPKSAPPAKTAPAPKARRRK